MQDYFGIKIGDNFFPVFTASCTAKNEPFPKSNLNQFIHNILWFLIGSDHGSELLHDIGVDTGNLEPPLDYVPWIIFNDVS